MNNTKKLRAILVREIIDLGREHYDDTSTLESLSEICFTLDKLLDKTESSHDEPVDWNELFSVYDKRYYALAHSQPAPDDSAILDHIYSQAQAIIDTD